MKKCVNGTNVVLSSEEIAEMNAQAEQAERKYWLTIPYDEAVNTEIRKRYSESQEFAILRQKDEKPQEYDAYFTYCEQSKSFVKSKKAEFAE